MSTDLSPPTGAQERGPAANAPADGEMEGRRASSPLRVLFVIPASTSPSSMIFASRQADVMEVDAEIAAKRFHLASRTSPRVLLQEFRRLRAESDAFGCDVVHAHYGTMTAFLATSASRAPVVVTFRGSDLNPAPSMSYLRWRLGATLSQMAALRASAIVCVSEELRNRLWWRKDRVTVLPTGVDTRVFGPQPVAEARKRLGWGPDERVVLFNAGTTPAVKRLDLAEAAVRDAESRCGSIRFVVLRGDSTPEQVVAMMNGANCLLLTSDYEGSPTVIQEAMACDLPVVSVDVGDVKERLRAVEPTRIVDRSPEAIGCAIAEVVSLNVRSNGFEAARTISLEALRPKLMEVYRRAAARRRA